MSIEKDKDEPKDSEEEEKKPVKKTQGQLIQEALGLDEDTIASIEKELFITKFLDTVSEDIFDYIYRDSVLDKYLEMLKKNLNEACTGEKVQIIQIFENQQIEPKIKKLKDEAEKIAKEHDINNSIQAKIKRTSLVTTIPLLVMMGMLFIFPDLYVILMIPVCFLCFLPQLLRANIMKKWNAFKEENKKYFYQENREVILHIKDYVQIILDDIRSTLLDKKIPLQIIKFSLTSNDYKNITLLGEHSMRGITQYSFTFEYPPGIEPFEIPEIMKKSVMAQPTTKSIDERDHFLVLKNVKISNGEIESFVVELKDDFKETINSLLNACDFEKAKDFSLLMPNYTPETAIHCVCGDIAEFSNVQKGIWKDFKFYLFESEVCKCGETIYVLSIIEENAQIPSKWEKIFK